MLLATPVSNGNDCEGSASYSALSATTCATTTRKPAPDVKGPWYSLAHTFVMEAGRAKLPRPPITGKARGERPKIPHLA
jgi:hypothetical protein